MSRFNRSADGRAAVLAPTADPAEPLADDLVARRLEDLQALVDQVEATIWQTQDLIVADAALAQEYAAIVIRPWVQSLLAKHEEFRVAVVSALPDLREATSLIQRGDAAVAVAKYGELLSRIRDLEQGFGAIKKQRPDEIPRVSQHQTASLQRRPSIQAEPILELLFAGQAERAALGQIAIDDALSRLTIENVDAATITIHLGTSIVYCWNHPAVLLEQAVPAQA